MTNKELQEVLKNFPDDMDVVTVSADYGGLYQFDIKKVEVQPNMWSGSLAEQVLVID